MYRRNSNQVLANNLFVCLCASPERSWVRCSKGTGSSCPGSSCSWISPTRHCPSTLKPTTLEDTTSKSKVGEEGFQVCQNLADISSRHPPSTKIATLQVAHPVPTFHQQLADMCCFSPNIISGPVSIQSVRKSSRARYRDTERIAEKHVKLRRLLCFDEALCLIFAEFDSDVEYLPPEDDDRSSGAGAPVHNAGVHEAVQGQFRGSLTISCVSWRI